MDNARFWVSVNGGWAKITLKPCQTLRWSQGGPTDEGWHADFAEWTHVIDYIDYVTVSDGVDCDGRLTRTTHLQAEIGELHAIPCKVWKDVYYRSEIRLESFDAGFSRPDWQEVSSNQYDQFAQAAGY